VFKSVVDAVVDAGMIVLPTAFRITTLGPLLGPDFCSLPSHARRGLYGTSYCIRGGGIFCGRRLQFSASCPGGPQACTGETGDTRSCLLSCTSQKFLPRRALPECEP